jgi:hypothetical protein
MDQNGTSEVGENLNQDEQAAEPAQVSERVEPTPGSEEATDDVVVLNDARWRWSSSKL